MDRDASDTGEPRPANTAWHISWQAAAGRQFFSDPVLYERIRSRLIDAHARGGRVLFDFLLLPTEIHVISLLPPGLSPESIARAIGNVVSRWVREVDPIRSPVLAGPYQAHRIDTVEALLADVRMLGWRPVRKQLIAIPANYPHGGLRVALGLGMAQGYDTRPLLELLGKTVSQARAELRDLVAPRPTEVEWETWELTHGLTLAAGNVGVQRAMAKSVNGPAAASLVAAAGARSIDGALALVASWVASKLDSRGLIDLHRDSSSAAARGRAIVAAIAVRHKLCSAAAVARYFGRARATLSEQLKGVRESPVDRRLVSTPVHRIVAEARVNAPGAKADPPGH